MKIRVFLRCRPLFAAEKLSGVKDVVSCTGKKVSVVPIRVGQRTQTFTFENVYNRATQQYEIFDESIRPVVMNAIGGYNVTVFAYGQTGTGKTYTMEGEMGLSKKNAGIIPRSVYTIFDVLTHTTEPGDWGGYCAAP